MSSTEVKRVLVLCGDRYHPAEMVMEGLRASVGSEFAFEVAPDGPLAELGEKYGAVVIAKLNVSSPTDPLPWADAHSDELLRKFVMTGGGLVVIHGGTVGYQEAPSIRQMTGGKFLHHPDACEVTFQPLEGFDLAAGTIAFTRPDEHYFVDIDGGQEVFLVSRSPHGEQPAGWTSSFGGGRVCVLTPGHEGAVWKHPEFKKLINKGLNWVTHG